MKRSVHNLRPAPQEDRNRGPVLWVVSELYYPELTSTGYYLTAIAERLAARRTVKALCGQPAYSARGTRVARRETRNGVVIHRASGTVWNKDRLFGKLVNLATLSLAIFVEALFRIKRGDTALVVTNPPLLPFLIAAVCRLKGARCVLLIHDVYPNVLVAAGMVRENHPVVRLINACVRGLYRRVDRVVTIGRDMAMLAAEKLAGSIDHLSIIANGGEV